MNSWSEYKRRQVADDSLAFSTTVLRQMKLTDQSKYVGAYSWNKPDGVFEMNFNIAPNYDGGLCLELIALTLTENPEKSKEPKEVVLLGQEINLHSLPIPRGGRRWWMECPIVKSYVVAIPKPCSKRCAVLYYSTKLRRFGCRACLDLTYRCRANHNKTRDKFKKNPELAKATVLAAHQSFQALDAEGVKMRKEGLFKGFGPIQKGQKTPGNSGGSSRAG